MATSPTSPSSTTAAAAAEAPSSTASILNYLSPSYWSSSPTSLPQRATTTSSSSLTSSTITLLPSSSTQPSSSSPFPLSSPPSQPPLPARTLSCSSSTPSLPTHVHLLAGEDLDLKRSTPNIERRKEKTAKYQRADSGVEALDSSGIYIYIYISEGDEGKKIIELTKLCHF